MGSLPAENIYQRLSDLRNGTGKSQKEVADDLGIQASVLSRIERGETKAVNHDLVIKLAKYYNVSTDYLLCISDVRIRKMWSWKNWGCLMAHCSCFCRAN